MDKMKATLEVQEIQQNRTMVTAIINYNTTPAFMGGIIKGNMAKMFFKLLLGLKYYLETGEEVSKNSIQDIMKTYKLMEVNDSFAIETFAN